MPHSSLLLLLFRFDLVLKGGEGRGLDLLLLFFLSAAKPSDLGTLGVVLLVVGGGDLFWFPMCSFSEVCSKVARLANIISKPKQHFAKVCSRFAGFLKTHPSSNISRGAFKEICSKRCIEHTSGNVTWEVI